MTRLDGSVAWVTGAGRGIGAAVARSLAGDGAAVVVSARSRAEVEAVAHDIESTGGSAVAVVCDVTDCGAVEAAYAAAVAAFRHVDLLINNAGFAESAPLVRLEPDLWDRTVAVNLTGTYYCMRAAMPAMVERGTAAS